MKPANGLRLFQVQKPVSGCRSDGVSGRGSRSVSALFALHLLFPSSTMTDLLRAAGGAMKKNGQTHHLGSYCRTRVKIVSVNIGNLPRLSVIYGDLRFFFAKP